MPDSEQQFTHVTICSVSALEPGMTCTRSKEDENMTISVPTAHAWKVKVFSAKITNLKKLTGHLKENIIDETELQRDLPIINALIHN